MIGNNINKLFDYKKKAENNRNNEIDKNFGDMETPILLNTPKLTGRIIDVILNLFEKVKNMNEKEIIKKPPKKPKNIKEENSNEIEEIILHEGTLSSNKNTSINLRQNIKNKSETKLKYKKLKNNDFSNILLLNEDCLKTLFIFFDLNNAKYFYFVK